MSNNMLYRDEIQINVTSVLNQLLRSGGKVTGKFLFAERERLQGKRGPIVLNVAIMALGLPMVLPLTDCFGLNERELGWLVEEAQKKNITVLGDIKVLREQKATRKEAPAPVQEPEPAQQPQLEETFAATYWNDGKFFGEVLLGREIHTSEGFSSIDEARSWCLAQAPRIRFATRREVGVAHHANNRSDSDWNATLWR